MSRRWVVCSLVALAAGALYIGLTYENTEENEREASSALKTLTVAEVDFRSNDRDDNKINDFWVGDISELFALRLISRELAEADAAPLKPLVPKPVPYKGYLFRVMTTDEYGVPYASPSGGDDRRGAVYNNSKFAFTAYPARYESSGRRTFLVNEGNTIFARDLKGEPVLKFPTDEEWSASQRTPESPTPILKIDDASRLAGTTVTAHLTERHVPGRSLLWCASFQLAWNEFCDHLKAPVAIAGAEGICESLNRRLVVKEMLDDRTYLVRAGWLDEGIIPTIRKEMSRRFPEATVPLPSENESFSPLVERRGVAFAYLYADLPFETSLSRQKEFTFGGRRVTGFGLRHDGARKASSRQLATANVLEFASESDFVVELLPSDIAHRIIVARVAPRTSLLETVQTVLKRAKGPGSALKPEDDLLIPCMNFDLTRNYGELMRRQFVNPPDPLLRILGATQVIKFRLDESGARMESSAKLDYVKLNGADPNGRRMLCNAPFLVMLIKKGADLPYFAFWVENTELLVP